MGNEIGIWSLKNKAKGRSELVVWAHGRVNGVGKCGMITDRIQDHWRVIHLK